MYPYVCICPVLCNSIVCKWAQAIRLACQVIHFFSSFLSLSLSLFDDTSSVLLVWLWVTQLTLFSRLISSSLTLFFLHISSFTSFPFLFYPFAFFDCIFRPFTHSFFLVCVITGLTTSLLSLSLSLSLTHSQLPTTKLHWTWNNLKWNLTKTTHNSHVRLGTGWKNCPRNCPLVCNDWLYSSYSRFVSLFLINHCYFCFFFLWTQQQFHWKCNTNGWFNCITQFITNIKPSWKSSGQRIESVFSFTHSFSEKSKSN